jgi:hypothetical protein
MIFDAIKKIPALFFKKDFSLKSLKVKKVFFVLSTGRCGTKYLATILNLAENAVVLHEPPPGAENINSSVYELFVKNKRKFIQIGVQDFTVLRQHANIYRTIDAEIFGDCYNSYYPFATAFYNFYTQKNIDIKFIHLVRHPFQCCSSILRAEGPYGIGIRKNFGLRAKLLGQSETPAEIASNVWIRINEVIRYEIEYIERLSPRTTRLVRIEDMKNVSNIIDLYNWLGLRLTDIDKINAVMRDKSDEVRHSHQSRLDEMQIPKITHDDLNMIKAKTESFLQLYGYEE